MCKRKFYNKYLHFCLTAEPNIALKKPAKQSTTYAWAGESSPASLAVDGNNGTDFVVDKCSCTKGGDTSPWWLVDLQAVYHIDYVRIFNRGMDKWGAGKRTY